VKKKVGIQIGVLGAYGRMGREVTSVLEEKKISFTRISREELKGKASPSFNVIIDFSTAEATSDLFKFALKHSLPVVSGTTGFEVAQKLQKLAQDVPVLWSANMSLGVAVLKKSLESLQGLQSQMDFDFQIEEFHHNKKLDSPSGTALALQKKLSEILTSDQKKRLQKPQALRLGGIYGVHKVHAVSSQEWLCFQHEALSRRVFASGAVTAALWLKSRKAGFYTLEDLLESGK
jgi:4-hydroxy-tetrahydrodipicolinate reductase